MIIIFLLAIVILLLIALIVIVIHKDVGVVHAKLDTSGIEYEIRLLRNSNLTPHRYYIEPLDKLGQTVRHNQLNAKLGLIEQHLYSISESLKKK